MRAWDGVGWPHRVYHPTLAAFMCPSLAFIESLPDKEQWSTDPKVEGRWSLECPNCARLERELEELRQLLSQKTSYKGPRK